MKKILSVILALFAVFSIVSCGPKYKPVKSTKEEARVIMTITVGEEEYDLKYELYRALFLNNKSIVDGGDSSVWSGADSQKYIDQVNKIIVSEAAEIFSAFALAEKLDIDPYSKEIDKEVTSRIEMSVDGNGADITGFGGDYDAYLASLKAMNINYSVQELMIRRSVIMELINEHYLGVEDEALGHLEGDYQFTRDDVKAFYNSEDCVRVFHAFVGKNKMNDANARVEKLREDILKAESEKDIALLIINRTTAVTSDLLVGQEVSGIVIGKDTISDGVYSEYRDTAFSLGVGQLSEVIEVGGTEPGYYLIYVLEKNEDHFNACYETVKLAYLNNVVGEELKNFASEAESNVEYSDKYSDIDHSNISMN